MTTQGRRTVLRTLAVTGAGALAAVFAPLRAFAAWPKAAFDAKTPKELIDTLFKGAQIEKHAAVVLVAPDLAENGGIVPITVEARIPDVQTITILAEENPRALTSTYTLGKRASGPLSVRVKLAKTQNVTAIVQAGGKTYSATKRVTVSVGGCGG